MASNVERRVKQLDRKIPSLANQEKQERTLKKIFKRTKSMLSNSGREFDELYDDFVKAVNDINKAQLSGAIFQTIINRLKSDGNSTSDFLRPLIDIVQETVGPNGIF